MSRRPAPASKTAPRARTHEGDETGAPVSQGVSLRVVPNAPKTEVVGLHGSAIKLKVASPALEGKANAAILEFIAETAAVPCQFAILVAGAKSRDKVVRVEGMSAEALRNRLLQTLKNSE
jgi:hypothetical protein